MGLGLLLFIGGLVIIAGLFVWSRQRQALGFISVEDHNSAIDLPVASGDDAVLVSREHGQLVFVNENARKWLGMNGGDPSLEYIAAMAQPTDSFLELFAGATRNAGHGAYAGCHAPAGWRRARFAVFKRAN